MYHYVRDLKHSRYPEIKGLDIFHFKEQIYYLKKYYNFITMEMLIDSIDNNSLLPPKSVLLTFDDAYSVYSYYVDDVVEDPNYNEIFQENSSIFVDPDFMYMQVFTSFEN